MPFSLCEKAAIIRRTEFEVDDNIHIVPFRKVLKLCRPRAVAPMTFPLGVASYAVEKHQQISLAHGLDLHIT